MIERMNTCTPIGWPRAVRRLLSLLPAASALALAACSLAPQSARVREPLRVDPMTYHVTDAYAQEWIEITPDNPEYDPSLWRPSTMYVRQRAFMPDSLADAEVWVVLRMEIFSDADPTAIPKEDVTLVGGDGERYVAAFTRDVAVGGDEPPRLSDAVASAAGTGFVTTREYPNGGPGSVAVVEAYFAVLEQALHGAALRVRDPQPLRNATIDLGEIPLRPSGEQFAAPTPTTEPADDA